MAIPRLPDDMIFVEILPRLPVKSLLKFKSVSKSWHSLISSNQFIKTNLSKSSYQRIMLNYSNNMKHCNLQSMLTSDHPLFDAIDTSYIFPLFDIDTGYIINYSKTLVWVVGSCDGLILLRFDEKDFILWNPCTRKFKKLPPSPFQSTPVRISFACGLGFDKHTDDYKVFVFYDGSDMLDSSIVYSLRTNEWTRVGKNCTGQRFTNGAYLVFANGKLHCVGNRYEGWKIMSFDVETEEYGVLKVPDYDLDNILSMQLFASQGCLYLICHKDTDHTDVWIVEGYELGKVTFNKLATLPMENRFWSTFFTRQFLYVEKNGEILLRFDHKFMVFNTNDGTFKNLDITVSLPGGSLVKALAYVESLVSPFV